MDVRKIKGKLHEAYPYMREKSTTGRGRNKLWTPIILEPRCWNTARGSWRNSRSQNEYDRLRNALQETVLRRSIVGSMVRGPRITGDNEENVLRRIAELEAQGAKK